MSLMMLGKNSDRDRGSYEKLSIRDSARSLKKYGSTSTKTVTKNENYIKHFVGNSDTLQGIALKYNVNIEQIRRANKLWASDSLFLREFLLIPVPDDASSSSVSSLTESQSSSSLISPSTDNPNRNSVSSTRSSTRSSFDDDNISDFLSKIDASIANTKEVVKKVATRSEFASESDFTTDRRKPVSRMKQAMNNNNPNEFHNPMHGLFDLEANAQAQQQQQQQQTPHAVVVQQGKKVRTSIELLKAQQDELFEL